MTGKGEPWHTKEEEEEDDLMMLICTVHCTLIKKHSQL